MYLSIITLNANGLNAPTKIHRGKLRIVWKMEKQKKLIYIIHGHELKGENAGGRQVQGRGG